MANPWQFAPKHPNHTATLFPPSFWSFCQQLALRLLSTNIWLSKSGHVPEFENVATSWSGSPFDGQHAVDVSDLLDELEDERLLDELLELELSEDLLLPDDEDELEDGQLHAKNSGGEFHGRFQSRGSHRSFLGSRIMPHLTRYVAGHFPRGH